MGEGRELQAVGRVLRSVTGPPGDRGARILVVDDERDVLDIMVECLSLAGYDVLSAHDGEEGLRIFQRDHPALVITDLSMPGMGGLELAKTIKALSPPTEVLIVTGHSTMASAMDALRHGVFDYLLKPLTLGELELSVQRALERSRLVEENRALVRKLEERIQVQTEALSASQRRTLAVFNSISDAVVIVNREFIILDANEGAATSSGVPAAELVGRKCHRELFGRDEVCPGCPVQATFDTGRAVSVSMQREDRAGSADSRELEVHSYALISGEETVREAVEHIRDVTEYRRAEEERLALRAQRDQDDVTRVIGRLAGGIAHDFNNQLTVIKGCAEFLLDAMPADDPGREDAERISETADRGARLVRQLLAFSRKQKIQPRPLRLQDLVNEMVAMFRPLLGEQVLARVRTAAGLWRVRADPGQIEQMIMNLVVNARDSMVAPGERFPAGTLTVEMANVELDEKAFRPTLEAVAPGQYVMLAVSDTGSGMTEDVRRQIFEPFFTTKASGKGTGLGLSTVFGIVKQHRGYVLCDSRPGHGSTFRVYLPRDEEEGDAPAEEMGPVLAPGLSCGGAVTSLVVDDEPEVREIVKRGLEASGYRVHTAGGLQEALTVAAAAKGPIQLLVTDVVMPGGSGRVLAERLVATFPKMKVLFISGYFDDGTEGPEVPGAFFLQKPFSPNEIARKAHEILDL
ncbi:MAG: response regulator [Candidatus Rokubacteria bacterium]|nr:response regulator [Candidatus Rokubacteria bacterium]